MSNLSPAFSAFLYATVCEERNEMPLSVISVLARLDLDPWTEAADLAQMPADGAALRLSALLAVVQNNQHAPLELSATAARLVKLLPQSISASGQAQASAARVQSEPRLSMPAVLCVALLLAMATSFLIASLDPGQDASHRDLTPIASPASRPATTGPTGIFDR
jgi:hypothetical protein